MRSDLQTLFISALDQLLQWLDWVTTSLRILPPASHEKRHRASAIHPEAGAHGCLQQFGEDIAILAGDALLSLSFEYIARETRGVDPARVLRVSSPPPPSSPSISCAQRAHADGKPLRVHTQAGHSRTSKCGNEAPALLRCTCSRQGRGSCCDAQPRDGEELSLLWAAESGRVRGRR